MDSSTFKKLARSPVASALVGVVALGVLLAMPMRESAARAPAGDGDLAGLARVIDGDTLEIAGRHVRLEGIDAPESGQTCGRRLIGSWRCGSAAADALAKLVAKRRVSCESRGNDKYDRMLGICFVDGRDINAEMVREGFAWAFVKYSQTYVKQEAEARVARVGIWQGDAEPAWVYREKRWAGAEQERPRAARSKATSPITGTSITCRGALGTARSRSRRRRASAGSAARRRPFPRAGGPPRSSRKT
jgi:endonuclease YncB( thermonuclease family)